MSASPVSTKLAGIRAAVFEHNLAAAAGIMAPRSFVSAAIFVDYRASSLTQLIQKLARVVRTVGVPYLARSVAHEIVVPSSLKHRSIVKIKSTAAVALAILADRPNIRGILNRPDGENRRAYVVKNDKTKL